MPEDEEMVVNVTEPTSDVAAQGTEPNAGNETTAPNGTFGSKGETASILSKSSTHDPAAYMPEDEEIVINVIGPTADTGH